MAFGPSQAKHITNLAVVLRIVTGDVADLVDDEYAAKLTTDIHTLPTIPNRSAS